MIYTSQKESIDIYIDYIYFGSKICFENYFKKYKGKIEILFKNNVSRIKRCL